MLNNGIVFGDQGPLMEGTWYNPTTDDSFTVKDSFFEDGQYIVTTTDGRMLGYDMIQNYIKSDKPIFANVENNNIPKDVIDELDEEIFIDDDIYGVTQPPTLGNINKPLSYSTKDESPSFNVSIIKKALDKYTRPQVDCNIVWDNFPKKEIQMLNEIMEIDTKEIVDWYVNQLDTTEIAIAIHNSIVSYINDQLYGRVDDESRVVEVDNIDEYTYTQTSVVINDTPKTPKKSSPKKITKKSTKK